MRLVAAALAVVFGSAASYLRITPERRVQILAGNEAILESPARAIVLAKFRRVDHSCGQLIDPYGSQGEQLHHTNYNGRGGYNEAWTVFWITAHFLTGAAQFAELGVPIWE